MKQKTEIRIYYFLKFGREKDILDLYENGTIYFNTIDYFQQLEEQGLRGDNYEGTTNIKNYGQNDKVKLQLKIPNTDKIINLNPTNFHLREFMTEIKANIFCLYALKSPEILNFENFKIDGRVKDFGSHFLIIQDVEKFLNKISVELKRLDISHNRGLVEYYDKHSYNGEVGPFHKPFEFDYQKEYRYVLYRKENNPFSISIGSLKEYSKVFDIEAIESLKMGLKDNG